MGEEQQGGNKRRHRRVAIKRVVRARSSTRELKGTLKDISAGGAALIVRGEVKDKEAFELEIEKMSRLPGQVARAFDDGFAVEFTLDDEEEDRLISELAGLDGAERTEDN